MNNQYRQFSQKYENISFCISLTDSADDNILNGHINFTDDANTGEKDLDKNLADIYFLIFNSCDLEDITILADGISGDLEYVAGAYERYCDSILGIGSVAIIEDMILHENVGDANEEIQQVKYFLGRAMEQLQIIGIGTVLFMTRALMPAIDKYQRIDFIDQLVRMKILPIYQDASDVVMARNMDYKIEE